MNDDKYTAMLAVEGRTLDPDAVRQQLGVAPYRSFRKGDPGPVEGVARRRFGAFQLKSDDSPTAEEAIVDLLGQLPSDADLASLKSLGEVTIAVFVSAGSRQELVVVFDPPILARLAAAGVTVRVVGALEEPNS